MQDAMKRTAVALAVIVLAGVPSLSLAQSAPQKLEVPAVGGTLAVLLTDSQGSPAESFTRSSPPVLDINFTLAMSPTGTYPLSFTLIQEAGGDKVETPVWSGTLEEGSYRFSFPVQDMPSGGRTVAVKLVMRVRMFIKKYSSESTYQYYNWEGSYRLGK